MGFFGRLSASLTGKGKSRLPDQMAILGAPPDLVNEARAKSDEAQEELFIRFVEGKHACMLDWRATRDDVYEGLVPLLSGDESQLLPPKDNLPEDVAQAISAISTALRGSRRALVRTESLGDFSFLILVPLEKEREFIQCVGPWLITENA